MSRTFQLCACAAVLLAASVVVADDKSAPAPTKIDGTYAIISGERDGKPMADADIKNCKVTITGDKITGTDKDGKEFLNATYTVEEPKKEDGKKACVVRMETTGGKKYMGMAEKTADGLKIVYQLDGGQPPTEFKAGEKQVLLVLKSAA